MRSAVRTILAILEASFTADRRLTLIAGAVAVAGWIVIPLQALAIKLFIDAVVARDAGQGILATVAAAITMGGLWYFNNLKQFTRLTLRERTTHELDRRLQRLVGGIPGIEHLERPDYLDRLETLRRQSHFFGNVGVVFEFPALTLNVVVTALLLASVDPILLFVPLAVLPAISLSGRVERILRAAEQEAAPARRLRLRMLVMATDPAVAGEARLFAARDELLARHAAADRSVNRVLARAGVADVVLNGLGWFVYAIAFVAVFIVVVSGIRAGRLGIGDFFLAFYLVRGMTWQTQYFLYSIGDFRRTLTATQGYLWMVDYAAEAAQAMANRPSAAVRPRAERPSAAPAVDAAPAGPGDLRFQHVSFHYPGTARDVLSDVNVTVPAGGVLALVGDNGAGKTTLVKLLARFYEPTQGRIVVGERDLGDLDLDEWRSALTACFQDFCRFELLARETVGVGDLPRIDDRDRVAAAVAGGGADAVVASFPLGLDAPLGASWPDGAELSVGQWQKLALARAMMREAPRLLLLDEPTAALDAESEARLLERYAAASSYARTSGSITVIVSHRMSTVRMADVIAVVEQGRIAEVGSHEELLARNGLYGELYATQAAAYR